MNFRRLFLDERQFFLAEIEEIVFAHFGKNGILGGKGFKTRAKVFERVGRFQRVRVGNGESFVFSQRRHDFPEFFRVVEELVFPVFATLDVVFNCRRVFPKRIVGDQSKRIGRFRKGGVKTVVLSNFVFKRKIRASIAGQNPLIIDFINVVGKSTRHCFFSRVGASFLILRFSTFRQEGVDVGQRRDLRQNAVFFKESIENPLFGVQRARAVQIAGLANCDLAYSQRVDFAIRLL